MNFYSFLQDNPVILLSLIVVIGFVIGRIRIFGFSFETSAILLVAMFFGQYRLDLPEEFQTLGLILFIYSIGLQAGPSIFNIGKKEGFQLNLIVLILISFSALFTTILARLFSLDMALAIGLFTGALTSTPGLAAGLEATGSSLTSAGYGLAYSFGVIGVIIYIRVLPYIIKANLEEEEKELTKEEIKERKKIIRKEVIITNEELDGKTLGDLNFFRTTNTIISRILHQGKVLLPKNDTTLHLDDVVRIVGEENFVKATIPLLGKETEEKFPDVSNFESNQFVLTNKEFVGKTIGDLNLREHYNANITRVKRGGLEFTASSNLKLHWGDKITVVGDREHMEDVKRLFGDEIKKIEYGDIFPIMMGILFGIFIGLIPFSIGKVLSFNLGVSGGVLLMGILLSNRGKVGPIIFQVPAPLVSFMRDFGLVLFLSSIGIKAGSQIGTIIQKEGFQIILLSILITIVPMVVITIVLKTFFKKKVIEMLGIISGGMTSSPGLAVASNMTDSQRPIILYATVYPFAMILMIIWAKIMALL